MEELFKNSLLGQLNELGLNTSGAGKVSDETVVDILKGPNPLSISVNEEDIKNSPFADNPVKEEIKTEAEEGAKKRLNDLDMDILQESAVKKAQDEFSGSNVFGKILYKYFPKIYKGFLLKRSLNKLKAINQTAAELISKKIPYGESEERYNTLINHITSANAIQARLVRKI